MQFGGKDSRMSLEGAARTRGLLTGTGLADASCAYSCEVALPSHHLYQDAGATSTSAFECGMPKLPQGHVRTLSTYPSVGSLLRRTMHMNTHGVGNTARQASLHALFPGSTSESDIQLSPSPLTPPSSGARTSPPVLPCARTSFGSMRSSA